MCVAVRHVTYGKPSVLIRYLFTITMLTEDETESANAPTVPISIGDALFPPNARRPGNTKAAPRDPPLSWSFASSAWIDEAAGTSAEGMCLPNPDLLDMHTARAGDSAYPWENGYRRSALSTAEVFGRLSFYHDSSNEAQI
jgi:hypothetical protein